MRAALPDAEGEDPDPGTLQPLFIFSAYEGRLAGIAARVILEDTPGGFSVSEASLKWNSPPA